MYLHGVKSTSHPPIIGARDPMNEPPWGNTLKIENGAKKMPTLEKILLLCNDFFLTSSQEGGQIKANENANIETYHQCTIGKEGK